jgi:hypothetical protein
MRKFLVISIPIVTLILFIIIMLSDNYLKNPISNGDNIPLTIEEIRQEIEKDNWEESIKKTDNLSNAWDKVVKRIQFSAEKDEIDGFYMNLSRLRGAIAAMDKSNAFMELNEAYEHWGNLGR